MKEKIMKLIFYITFMCDIFQNIRIINDAATAPNEWNECSCAYRAQRLEGIPFLRLQAIFTGQSKCEFH